MKTQRLVGKRGERLRVDAKSDSVSPHIEVLRPDGSLECGPGWDELDCTLDATGTHSLLVKDEYGSKTGTYTLSLRHPSQAPPATAPGESTSDQNGTGGGGTTTQDGGSPSTHGAGGPSTQLLVALIAAMATIVAAWLGSRPRLGKRKKHSSSPQPGGGPEHLTRKRREAS